MISSMSDEFLDWLNECHCQWFLIEDDGEGNSEYSFIENRPGRLIKRVV